jgi:hypothetical protein
MSRREIESLLGRKLTDEEWEENKKVFKEYEKKHAYDDLDE